MKIIVTILIASIIILNCSTKEQIIELKFTPSDTVGCVAEVNSSDRLRCIANMNKILQDKVNAGTQVAIKEKERISHTQVLYTYEICEVNEKTKQIFKCSEMRIPKTEYSFLYSAYDTSKPIIGFIIGFIIAGI